MSDRLGAAVVGLGVGEAHARAYAALPECGLRWVYDLDAQRARAVAATLPGVAVAPDLAAVLDDPGVDLVSIASYDDAHADHVVAALQARKHVFVEKPLCRTMDELTRVRNAWAGNPSLHLGSNLVLRAAPVFLWLQAAVGRGEFGRIYAFDGDYLYGRLSKITDGWRSRVPDYSAIEGGGIHLIDLMLRVTGERPCRVTGAGNRLCTTGTAFEYQDFQAATFEFPSSLVGRITANFGCVHPHQHVVRVFGTDATFVHDDLGPRVYRSRDEGRPAERVDLAARPSSKGALIAAFVDGIRRHTDPAPCVQQEFDLITTCVTADRAARLEESFDVDYV